jgi:hypothetical protein
MWNEGMVANNEFETILMGNTSIYKPMEKQENHENIRVSAVRIEISIED